MKRSTHRAFGLFITLTYSLTLGVYVNAVSKELEQSSLSELPSAMGSWNVLAVVSVVLLYIQFRYFDTRLARSRYEVRILVERILENACRSVGQSDFGEAHVRAIVTMLDKKKQRRFTRYSYNVLIDPEKTASYKADFGVTGEAFTRKVPVAQKLDSTHMEEYDGEHKGAVAPELRCVLAAPIFSPGREGEVIGVLAFDSFDDLIRRFQSRTYKEIAQSWANVLAEIIA